jgi:hypothetical protein
LVLGPVYKYVCGQGTYFARLGSKVYWKDELNELQGLGAGRQNLAELAEGDVLNMGTVEK